MTHTPQRIAQTSSEAKKLHKKTGPLLPARQQKQLERAHELDQRAKRLRDAEERRKAALKKRKQKEEKEKAARKQIGVGLATQLIGYSHTQAQLKNGMEAFLGVAKRKEEEKHKRELELTRQLERIVDQAEKEPWDEDYTADAALDLPAPMTNTTSQDIDDELDDDTLLEIHDLITSEPHEHAQATPQRYTKQDFTVGQDIHKPTPAKEGADFVRLHGPVNRTIEKLLEQLPQPLIELLSIDLSMKMPEWNPAAGLLHKLNPVGLPPHRLRLKVGTVVVLLRDLNTSSQLSKSQHLRVLRAETDRLECLVLDGQLEGTKTFITRVAFLAKYRNDDHFLFKRTQFPIRVATNYVQPIVPQREPSTSAFKPPSITSRTSKPGAHGPMNPQIPSMRPSASVTNNFKLPGRPASISTSLCDSNISIVPLNVPDSTIVTDGWDDFLESATQIARELSPNITKLRKSPSPALPQSCIMDILPPFSTQDLDFSMDDLDDAETSSTVLLRGLPLNKSSSIATKAASTGLLMPKHNHDRGISLSRRGPGSSAYVSRNVKPFLLRQSHEYNSVDLTVLRASQRPPSVSDRPGLKRKAWIPPSKPQMSSGKRQCVDSSQSVPKAPDRTVNDSHSRFVDFGISTQDMVSFFPDDDDVSFGSPPIAV